MPGAIRPGADYEGEAIRRALGPVIAVHDDVVTVDVGFPLEVDLDPILGRPELVPALVVGDSLAAIAAALRHPRLGDP